MTDHPPTDGVGARRIALGFGGFSAAPGDHIGHFYRTKEEWLDLVVPFLKTGLEAGDKCVYIMNPNPAQGELCEALSQQQVDVEAALASEQLVFNGGLSLPQEMWNCLDRSLVEIPRRFPLLRWGGKMSWFFEKSRDSHALMEWECMCNITEAPQAVFLCQYDLTQFLGSVVIDAMKTHPLCVISNTVHENPYYEKPEDFLERLRRRTETSGGESAP